MPTFPGELEVEATVMAALVRTQQAAEVPVPRERVQLVAPEDLESLSSGTC
jgi:hypothetical protein